MSKLAWMVLPFAAGLSACAGLPTPPSADGIAVDEITNAVQCEMANAYVGAGASKSSLLNQFAVGVKLELKVREENTAGASVKLVVPVMPIAFDSVTLNGGPSVDNTSYRYTTIDFDAALKDVRQKFVGPNGQLNGRCIGSPTGFEPASTSLGLGQWLVETTDALRSGDAAELNDMSYLLEFILIRNVSGGVSFASRRVQAASLTATSMRTRDNTLTVSFAKITPPPGPEKVLIVGYPPLPNASPPQVAPKVEPATPKGGAPSNSKLPDATKQRLDYLLNQHKLNSVISPNSVIVPY